MKYTILIFICILSLVNATSADPPQKDIIKEFWDGFKKVPRDTEDRAASEYCRKFAEDKSPKIIYDIMEDLRSDYGKTDQRFMPYCIAVLSLDREPSKRILEGIASSAKEEADRVWAKDFLVEMKELERKKRK